ncbi:MAG: fibronectin type III domain-containing protein [Syntrophomonadaceae bacterium]|jgi:hypothetical protein
MRSATGRRITQPGPRGRISCVVVTFLVFIFLGFMPASTWAEESTGPQQVVLTWTQDPVTSQTITWLAADSDENKVQYIEAAGFDGDFAAATQRETTGKRFAGSSKYLYTVTLTGLNPDTRYIYRVGRDGAWSKAFSFTTATDAENFTFLYLGDVQEGYDQWGNMLDRIYAEHSQIKFALLGGDLTNNGSNFGEWMEFLDAASDVFSRIPMMPAMGNHDGDLFIEFFALPENGPQDVIEDCFYSFDYGDAHFVVLDTSNIITDSVKQWLQEDLQNTDKKWKLAVFHHPPYQNFDDNKTIDDALRENWVPILEQNQVDMVFVGHQHVYMRTYPIFQGEITTDSYGIVYVMGNSGSKYYQLGQGFPYIAMEETGSNYQIIELKDDVLILTSRKADGELIEAYTLRKHTAPGEQKPVYYVTAEQSNLVYTSASTPEGLITMTVNSGISGLKIFTVGITPEVPHDGEETVVFTHIRNGVQLQLNCTRADFDQVGIAQAGFNVEAGDVIRAYIVDELTNDLNQNPVILQ